MYRFFLLAGVIVINIACASHPFQPQAHKEDRTGLEAVVLKKRPAAGRPELTEEVLYKLLVAEFARQRGQLNLSLDIYLELAHTIPDPKLAEWATRLALFAKQEDKALEAARLWVRWAGNDLEARQILAAMYIRWGKTQEALPHLEFVLSASNGNVGEKLGMVTGLLIQNQDRMAALRLMEQLVERRKQDPDALFAYALLALRAGQVTEAQEAMEKALKLAPTNLNFVTGYLILLRKTGQIQPALHWMEGQVSQYPKEFDLRMLYARLLAEAKRFSQARKQFEILARSDPENADVRYGLGLLYLQNNKLEEAKRNFTTLLSEEQYANEARYYLGQIAEARKDYEGALKWYSAIDDSNYFDAQLNIALVLARQKRIEEARDHLHTLKAGSPEQGLRILLIEGQILTETGRYSEAMHLYDQALGDRYNTELLYSRAMLAEKMGRLDIVERDLRRILEREPNNAQTLNALGFTLADRTDRYQEAYILIKRALELNPDDFYILDSMGWVLYRLGRLKEAVEYLRRAQQIRNDPEVAAHLGEVLWMMGDKAEARRVWESALKERPDDERLLRVIHRFGR